jgi:molecular chaperone HtpG
MSGETFAFQAEINQLLSLIINTFYSNKDVFLRELISNASDAIDKIRYESLTDSSVLGEEKDLSIKIIPDKEAKTLTIQDNGIGMTREDLIKNLGTIAHSGTRSFMEAIQAGQKPDINLIGQFGVGFYSAYLVANTVTVVSKNNKDEQYVWESNASGSFTVRKATDDDAKIERGTKIVLQLKEDHYDYLEEQKITSIVKKHSEYCSFPIQCHVEREEEVDVEEPEEVTVDDVQDSDEEGVSKEDTKPTEPKEKKKLKRKVNKWELLNKQQPIWLRKPDEVSKEEYASFYKSFANDWDEHLHVKHFSVDGQVQFKALLYIPKHAPFDMFSGNPEDKKRNNIKLYVKKVLIMDESNELLPEYLSFVKGIVDSDDLPLNVSREMLQQNNIMKVIKRNLVKKCIEMMSELANSVEEEDKGKWEMLYEAFSKNIKLGVHEDQKNKEKLVELLRFHSSKTSDKLTSLKDYVTRMKDKQTKIYYLTGESLKMVSSSPFIQQLKKRGIEVLYMVDTIDEYLMQALKEYDGKEMVCCSKDGFELELTDEEKKQKEELQKEWQPVCEKIKTILENKVMNVRLSDKLSDNPCVMVSDKYGWSANMERIVKSQALRNNQMMDHMTGRRIMEINPEHPILKSLKTRLEDADREKEVKNIIEMLYETVLIDSGYVVEDPSKYAQKIYRLISLGLSGDDETSDTSDSTEEDAENTESTDKQESMMEDLD